MNELQIFENPEFGEIRGMEIDGEPWFVGKDVAVVLGYSNHRKALQDHVDSEDKVQGDGVTIRDSMGREQYPVFINESGLYSLILSSKLPSAKRFKRWVTSEVLPALRKNHTYTMPGAQQVQQETLVKVAEIAVKIPNPRIATIYTANALRMIVHGIDTKDPVSSMVNEPQPEDGQREAEFVKLLKRYSLKELHEKLQMPKTSIYYYRVGKVFPHDKRYKAIIKILEG